MCGKLGADERPRTIRLKHSLSHSALLLLRPMLLNVVPEGNLVLVRNLFIVTPLPLVSKELVELTRLLALWTLEPARVSSMQPWVLPVLRKPGSTPSTLSRPLAIRVRVVTRAPLPRSVPPIMLSPMLGRLRTASVRDRMDRLIAVSRRVVVTTGLTPSRLLLSERSVLASAAMIPFSRGSAARVKLLTASTVACVAPMLLLIMGTPLVSAYRLLSILRPVVVVLPRTQSMLDSVPITLLAELLPTIPVVPMIPPRRVPVSTVDPHSPNLSKLVVVVYMISNSSMMSSVP